MGKKCLAGGSTLLSALGGVVIRRAVLVDGCLLVVAVCCRHLPGGNGSRLAELRERTGACGSRAGSGSRLGSVGGRRRSRSHVGSRGSRSSSRSRGSSSRSSRSSGRGSSRLFSWTRHTWCCRTSGSSDSWRCGSCTTTTETVTQQDLQALEFSAQFLQTVLVALPCTLECLGNGILQRLDFVANPAGLVIAPTRSILQIRDQVLHVLQRAVQSLRARFFRGLQGRSIR